MSGRERVSMAAGAIHRRTNIATLTQVILSPGTVDDDNEQILQR